MLAEKEAALQRLAQLHSRLLQKHEELSERFESIAAAREQVQSAAAAVLSAESASVLAMPVGDTSSWVGDDEDDDVSWQAAPQDTVEEQVRELQQALDGALADLRAARADTDASKLLVARAEADAAQARAELDARVRSEAGQAQPTPQLASSITSQGVSGGSRGPASTAEPPSPTRESWQSALARKRSSDAAAAALDARIASLSTRAETAEARAVAAEARVASLEQRLRDGGTAELEGRLENAVAECARLRSATEAATARESAAASALDDARREVGMLQAAEETSRRALAAEMWTMREAHGRKVAALEEALTAERARHKSTRAELLDARSAASSAPCVASVNTPAAANTPAVVSLPSTTGVPAAAPTPAELPATLVNFVGVTSEEAADAAAGVDTAAAAAAAVPQVPVVQAQASESESSLEAQWPVEEVAAADDVVRRAVATALAAVHDKGGEANGAALAEVAEMGAEMASHLERAQILPEVPETGAAVAEMGAVPALHTSTESEAWSSSWDEV